MGRYTGGSRGDDMITIGGGTAFLWGRVFNVAFHASRHHENGHPLLGHVIMSQQSF